MDKAPQVFETPDYPKTIEQLNEEIEPKSFPPVAGLITKQPDLPVADIFRLFEGLTQKQPETQYAAERKPPQSRFVSLTELETELMEVQRELAEKQEYDGKEELHKQASDLAALLARLKERAQKTVETGSRKWKTVLAGQVQPLHLHPSSGVTYELTAGRSIEEFQYRQRLSRLDERIKYIERCLGDWKGSKSLCETASALQRHVQMMNSSFLEHLENQSKNLSTDLDLLYLNSKSEFQVEKETVQQLSTLYSDVSEAMSTLAAVPSVVDKATAVKPWQDLSIRLNDRINRLEEIAASVLASASEQAEVCAALEAGIAENQEIVRRNLAQLSL